MSAARPPEFGEHSDGIPRAAQPEFSLVDHVDYALALAFGDLGERVLGCYGGPCVAVLVE